jgi:hypothetical protein
MNEQDWYEQKPDWIRHNEARGFCIESIDEKEYLEERRLARNREAKARRLLTKNK